MRAHLVLTSVFALIAAVPVVASAQSPAPLSAAPSSPVRFLWSTTGGPDPLSFPNDMALDPQGRLWVADTGNSRFAIFTPDGAFVEYWGTKGSGDGEFNLQRSNGDGYGAIEFAPDGSFYVLDVGNRRVQHFDGDRQFLGSWGGFGTEPGQYNDPIGLAVDARGVVYVLDDVRDVVEWYDADGTVLGSFAPRLAGANSANGMALDTQGNVYISACCAAGNEVRKFDASGSPVMTIGSPGIGDGHFSDQPGGLDVDADGRVLVTQHPEGPGSNVQIFGPDGSYLAKWGGPGGGDGQFEFPYGIVLDGEGSAYVADAGGGSIEKFRLLPPFAAPAGASPAAEVVASPAADAAPVTFLWAATGGEGDPMEFPAGVTVAPDGRIWVTDTGHDRIAIFEADGTFIEYWGTAGAGEGQFDLQRANGDGFSNLAFAPDGSFYVLDTGNRRVQHFDQERRYLNAWGGFGPDAGQFIDPLWLATDAEGVVYVVDDVRNVVEKYASDGTVLGEFPANPAPDGAETAVMVATDAEGSVYVTTCCPDNQVLKFDADGNLLATFGSAGTGVGEFDGEAHAMAIDDEGRLFVSQFGEAPDRIQAFAADGTPLGRFDDEGLLPFGIALDGQGHLYVTDYVGGALRKFDVGPPYASGPS